MEQPDGDGRRVGTGVVCVESDIALEDTPSVSPATRLSHSGSRDPLSDLTNTGYASIVVLVNSDLISRYRRRYRAHDGEKCGNEGFDHL